MKTINWLGISGSALKRILRLGVHVPLCALATLAGFMATTLSAQQAAKTNAPTPIETPAAAPAVTNAAQTPGKTNSPVANAEKKKPAKLKSGKTAAKKKDPATELKSLPLVPGPAIVIASNVNVRGRAGLKGEVLTHVTKGEPVTVLEEVILKKSAPDEPSAWAKIVLPTNTHVWVHSSFLDTTNKTVRPKKLNVRGGAGENYSVLGTLKRGETVKEISAKGDWLEIEPPGDAFAFVAAQYLKQEPPGTAPIVATEPAPTPATVAEAAPVTAAPTETPVAPAPVETPPTNTSAETATSEIAPEEPIPPRIVQREGIVRGTFSIQAPTAFELVSPETGKVINYLHTSSRDLDLRRYKGLHIIITGEEDGRALAKHSSYHPPENSGS